MEETKKLLKEITEGIQDKKGKQIVIADLTDIDDTICQYFVICQGNTPMQVSAIADSIKDFTIKGSHVKPSGIDGQRNAEWIAMDYGTVFVHIMQRAPRAFYDIENLWSDGKITEIANI